LLKLDRLWFKVSVSTPLDPDINWPETADANGFIPEVAIEFLRPSYTVPSPVRAKDEVKFPKPLLPVIKPNWIQIEK
jgi:hypothetical protein